MYHEYGVLSVCMSYLVGVFFFQAEDGIRDLVRSRGLGDVYKRQVLHQAIVAHSNSKYEYATVHADLSKFYDRVTSQPVSYTHLTLPTSDLV